MTTPLGLYTEDYSDIEAVAGLFPGADIDINDFLGAGGGTALVHAYFSPEQNPAECAAAVRGCLDRAGFKEISDVLYTPDRDGDGVYAIESMRGIAEEDWADNWKQYFKPLRVGKGVLVLPEWEADGFADAALADGADAVVRIDPGMAFGTGAHATTSLCIGLIEEYLSETAGGAPVDVLDVGCGSGILSIAAIRLGARSALGIDIDAYAVKNAEANARGNGLEDRIKFRTGDLLQGVDGRYGLVVANIAADAVVKLLSSAAGTLLPGGALVLSGVIDEREAEVARAATGNGFDIVKAARGEGWTAFRCERANINKGVERGADDRE